MNRTNTTRIDRAWQEAWQLRCCPPDAVLAGDLTSRLRQHLQICPSCRDNRERAPQPAPPDLHLPAAGRDPQPGELWSLRPELGGWGPKRRYYNPPVVLVAAAEGQGVVQVVQVSGIMEFAGPGDLMLDGGLTGFAQPWNRYTLQTGSLHACLSRISEARLASLDALLAGPDADAEPGSILWFFRQMEVETGWYFARQDLVQEFADTASLFPESISESTIDTLLADLGRLPVIPPALDSGLSIEDILARTEPDEALLPLAAAEQNRQAFRILLFVVEQGRIREARLVNGELTLVEQQGDILHVSGLCRLESPEDAHWIFRWQARQWSITPLPGQFGVEEDVFWAAFPVAGITNPEEGELVVRILVQR